MIELDRERGIATKQRAYRLTCRAIRYRLCINRGALAQMLRNKMLSRTKTDSRVVQFARLFVDEFDKTLDVGCGRIFRHDDYEGRIGEDPHRCKVGDRIVRNRLDRNR